MPKEIEEILTKIAAVAAEAGLSHALAGGLAANLWVSQERARKTYDIDLAVRHESGIVARVAADLERRGWSVIFSHDMPFKKAEIRRLVVEGVTVDFIEPRHREFARQALEHTASATTRQGTIAILTPENLILFKGLARRERDIASMADLAEIPGLDRAHVEKWARRLGVWGFVRRALKKF